MTGSTFQSYLGSIVKTIAQQYRPEKIILFGSAAGGHIREDSDADLAIIKKTDKNFYDRIGEVGDMVEHDIPLDIFVYTPEEFERMRNDKYGYFVREEILKKGKVVYDPDAVAGSLEEGLPTSEEAEVALRGAEEVVEFAKKQLGNSSG